MLLPLFSMPSTRSWGIGEIQDLVPMSGWLSRAGQDLLQLLPVNEMAEGQSSPYSAMSALAIDPIFISVWAVEEFARAGGLESLDAGERATLRDVQLSPFVDYARVRPLKEAVLRRAFERFARDERHRQSGRGAAFDAYVADQAWWLDDYSLFRALHRHLSDGPGSAPWTAWPAPLKARTRAALDRARRDLAGDILYYQYLQWVADAQWQEARRAAAPVRLFGDLPFMVSTDSADVWARQGDFDVEVSVGVPPDAFSATGQDWGLPAYRWDVLRANDFAWLRQRARRGAALFDGYRVDHLVGFYRTYVKPPGGEAYFTPAGEDEQTALGEHVMRIFMDSGPTIVAEDLGTVPDFVRASLARLGLPGYRVLRWEREWHAPGQPFRDPASYPARSVATSGTHDTETLAEWWQNAPPDERAALLAIPALRPLADLAGEERLGPRLRDSLLEVLFRSGSNWLILPFQDLFGWTERVNVPATVGDRNWTYRLPWPVDRLGEAPEAQDCARRLGAWSRGSARG